MYYVYILRSLKDNKIYTGLSNNLKRRRIKEHISGNVRSASRKPLKLVYYEAYKSKKDALDREKYLKSGEKAKFDLKNQIKNSLT